MLVSEVINRCRDRLNEPNEGHWQNRQLRRWLNDAMNDTSRMTRHIKDFVTSVVSVAGTSEYTLPTNVIEIEAVYWTDGTQQIPLTPVHYDGVDQVWGRYQNSQSGTPAVFTTFGAQPVLKIKLYPTPTTTLNIIRMYVSREAHNIDVNGTEDGTAIEFPNAWIDMLCDYVEYTAFRNDRNPQWQDAYQLYTGKRDALIQQTYLDVNRDIVFDPAVGGLPAWLVSDLW